MTMRKPRASVWYWLLAVGTTAILAAGASAQTAVIAGVQTGHNGGNRQRCAHHAIEWILHAYRREPHKPVINLEAMYDGQGENGWQAVDARSLAWRSWLSGAKGITRRMVLAKVAGRDFAVAYLSDNDAIEVNLSAFSAPVAAHWFDPVRGRSSPVTGVVPNQGTRRFQAPAKGDRVLVIGQG